ncbi:uncharacterized protein B0T15DRAFT_518952 [Chaetomium strumarium]|uniref:Uncharacterized protein n=1 Tax=Chaetomium strumarium TaxID=1170767 RepID=A0AAJ0H2G1_9PEZI|nr:hypothetical protein B0T15DRAFT_518952 [Chaetomium strumarium]
MAINCRQQQNLTAALIPFLCTSWGSALSPRYLTSQKPTGFLRAPVARRYIGGILDHLYSCPYLHEQRRPNDRSHLQTI